RGLSPLARLARPRRPTDPHLERRDERRGPRLPRLARIRDGDAAGRAPPVGLPPAPVHRAREARVAQAPERGAHGAPRPLSPDARGRLLVHARLLAPLLRGHGVAVVPDARAPRGAGGLRGGAAAARARVGADERPGRRRDRGRGRPVGAALLPAAAPPRPV